MCLCQTIAARYGALAGFGLSLAKWTFLFKHDFEMSELAPENRPSIWIWLLIVALGLLICLCAIIKYINIKREWKLLNRAEQARLLYFI